ncbi:DNA mismatch repair protein [Marasmius sp. AFHP31]|nr:DNA mismatch repair protein [Marasmius sp. AFHP31]
MASLPIEQLPLPTRTKLRSTQILTSLPQIVSELFQNSLDAGAKSIEVGVDCEEWMCWVTDDGHGISKDGLSLLSSAGRYGSSKAYDPDTLNVLSTFGFRGEALASAADLGCLEISSRTSRKEERYISEALTSSPNTRGLIKNAQLPVRRLSHPSSTRSFEIIRRELETYALVFPSVSFNLRLKSETAAKESTVRIPRSASSLDVFRHLYGKALCEHVHEVNTSQNDMGLEGFISLDGALSRTYQFLYVNRHPIEQSDLQRIVESRFASSSFAKHAYDESGESSLRPSTRRSPRKAEKKAVYVLNLIVPPDKVDNLFEPKKSVIQLREQNTVESLLTSAVDSFLIQYGFRAPTQRTRGNEDVSPSPQKRRKLHLADDSGYAEDFSGEISPYDWKTKPEVPKIDELYIGDVPGDGERPELGSEIIWTDATTSQTFVVDRRTGHSILQGDPRSNPGTSEAETHRERRTLPLFRVGASSSNLETPDWIRKALEANECYTIGEKKVRSIDHASRREEGEHGLVIERHSHWQARRPGSYSFRAVQSYVERSDQTSKHSFTCEDLHEAVVINQVDRKFVACALSGGEEETEDTGRTTLVLIDQHAADERVRVELFLRDLCLGFLRNIDAGPGERDNAVETRHLTPPVLILLTRPEVRRLLSSQEVRDLFWSWGISFSKPQIETLDHGEAAGGVDGDDSGSYAQIAVECIPEVVADKLLSAEELRDMVKSFLAQVDSGHLLDVLRHRIPVSESDQRNESDWLKALRWCPSHLLELVNSKACRGAIMFNDPLNNEQCERLVQQLSETALPFQCAHGRGPGIAWDILPHFSRESANKLRDSAKQLTPSSAQLQGLIDIPTNAAANSRQIIDMRMTTITVGGAILHGLTHKTKTCNFAETLALCATISPADEFVRPTERP